MAIPHDDINVFISSSYFPAILPYRDAAKDAVWRADLYPVGMERKDTALPVTTRESSREMVEHSAAYIGIFTRRYGAITVDELRWAEGKHLPILIFFAATPLDETDDKSDDSKAKMLADVKADLKQKYVVREFTTPADLGDAVYRALIELRQRQTLPEPSVNTSPHGRAANIIPAPPTPYIAHPYVLSQGGFVGRATELSQIDAWAQSIEPLLVIDAIGGAGKSALAWDWLHTCLDQIVPQRAGVIWWSFYESDATMSALLVRALVYLTHQPTETIARLPRIEQEEMLLGLMRQRPVVLVLDGVERLLVAYHRQDASHLTDAQVAEQPRACIDPRDGRLLRALAASGPSKALLTTRLIPQDLYDRSGQLVGGVRLLELYGLTPADAIALLTRAGVHGTHEVMRTFLTQFGDHALLVQILAGRIRAYRPAPGNFDAWYQTEGQRLTLAANDLTSRRTSILAAALADLDPAIFRFLCQMAAFRYPVDYAALVALNPFAPPAEPEPTPQQVQAGLAQLHAALSTLEERGLVQWERRLNRYDLHPVVRAYAYGQLADRAATFAQIRSYFEALPAEDSDSVQDVGDLRRMLEIYHALVEAGQFGAAIDLYYNRLDASLLFALGAYTTMVELLTPLFSQGFDQSPALSRQGDKSYAVSSLASAFFGLWEYSQAEALFGVATFLDLQERDALNLTTGIQNLGFTLQESGQLARARRAFRLALVLNQVTAKQENIDISHLRLTGLAAVMGDREQGEAEYAAIMTSSEDYIQNQPLIFINAARLLWGQGQYPQPLLQKALEQSEQERNSYAEREARRLQGEIALSSGDLVTAEEAWLAAYAIAQRQGVPFGSYLADLARLRVKQGQHELARQLIAQALDIGGPVDLAAAEVYLELGETAMVQKHIVPAYRRAWADGPPYVLHFELQRARAVLAALNMTEPALPPFDDAKVAPLPHEVEIRAFLTELQAEKQREEQEPDVAETSMPLIVDALPDTPPFADTTPPQAPVPAQRTRWWQRRHRNAGG